MIQPRRVKLAVNALLAMVALGCASAQSHFYTLDSTSSFSSLAPAHVAVAVGPVSVPAAVDQPQFVVQVAANRVDVDEFNRWASPLNESIARAVAGDLSTDLGTQEVTAAPLANFRPDYRVSIDVQRFESIRGQAAIIEAVWVVHKTAGGQSRSGRTNVREPVQGDDFDALAAAHSRALLKVSSEIAMAIRAEAGENRYRQTE
jgi:uncharacterized lipoprotein YmbA